MAHTASSHRFFCLLLASVALSGCNGAQSGNSTMTATVPPVELSKNWNNPSAPVVPPGDLSQRLAALEQEVGSLKRDFETAKPTLAKVEAAEKQFRALSLELDRISNTYGMAAPVVVPATVAPVKIEKAPPKPTLKPTPVKKPEEKPTAKKEAMPKGPVTLNHVRFGAQGDKTRVVLDLSGAGEFSYDLDNQEKILVIEVKSAKTASALAGAVSSSPLVASYTTQSDANGSRVVVQLKEAVKVSGSGALKPSGASGHRIYLDLAKI